MNFTNKRATIFDRIFTGLTMFLVVMASAGVTPVYAVETDLSNTDIEIIKEGQGLDEQSNKKTEKKPKDEIPGQCPAEYTKIVDSYSDGLSWTADYDYDSVILVGGPDNENNDDPDGRNKYFSNVKTGDTISRIDHDISHICAIASEEAVIPVEGLALTSMCTLPDGGGARWRVRNDKNDFDVDFTWEVYSNVETGGPITATFGPAFGSGDTFFESTNTGTMKIYWEDENGDTKETQKATNPTICEPEITTGTLKITKYECPADTILTRSGNGVGKTVPDDCTLDEGAYFGYVHGVQSDANDPYPELELTPTPAGSTDSNGVLEVTDLSKDGRYLVVETDSDNNKLAHDAILGLFCEGDGDENDTNNDNQELAIFEGDIVECVAYNKKTSENNDGNPTKEIKMCKVNGHTEEPISGWEMTLSNGTEEGTDTYTTDPETGCVTATVKPEDGPWTVEEVGQPEWELVDVDSENGSYVYEDESENKIGCSFFDGEAPSTESEYTCTFVNENMYGACLSVNLLSNGSFEEPVVGDAKKWEAIMNPLGWVAETVAGAISTALEFHRGWSGNVAHDGFQYVELDGSEPSRITQSVTTEDGAKYKLWWSFAPRQNTSADENKLSVQVNGTQVATEGPTAGGALPVAGDDWIRNSYEFTADSISTEIAFADAGLKDASGQVNVGTLLDHVFLCKITEPEQEAPAAQVLAGGGGGLLNPAGNVRGASDTRADKDEKKDDKGDSSDNEDKAESDITEPAGVVVGAQTSKIPTVAGASTGAGGTSPSPIDTMSFVALMSMLASFAVLRTINVNGR